nr:MAG TPA: hypothetical protein [Caudoviricetes sp.]
MSSQAPGITHYMRALYCSDNCCVLPRLWETTNKNKSRSITLKKQIQWK